MKNLIFIGCPRSGKSTISEKLTSTGNYYYWIIDSFIAALEKTLPECKIKHSSGIGDKDYKKTSKKLTKFISYMLESASRHKLQYRYIIDTYNMLPSDVSKHFDLNICDVYVFGTPNITVEERIKQIRENDKEGSYTYNYDDEEMYAFCNRLIVESIFFENESKKYNFKFIDTSHNREEVIEKLFNDINLNNK